MGANGSSCTLKVDHGGLKTLIEAYGRSWALMDAHDRLRTLIDAYGRSWALMGAHGRSLELMGALEHFKYDVTKPSFGSTVLDN